MRLLYLNALGSMGGAERVLVDVLDGVRRERPSWPTALVLGQDGPLTEVARSLVNEVVVLPFPLQLAEFGDASVGDRRSTNAVGLVGRALAGGAAAGGYVRRLRNAITAFEPDVVHSNSLKMHLLSAWTCPASAKLVWHLHDYVGSRPLTSRLLRRVRSPNAIIANSQSVADDAEQVLGDGVEIRTIHNGIDLQRYSPDGPALDLDKLAGFAPAEPGTVRVGLVATFALWKGHLTFLEAIANFLARRTGCLPAVRAYVIGGPLYETKGSQHALADLRGAARRLGVESTVAFTGFVPDTASAMRALDIVVHASTAPEPFGLVIAEAMATGRAVIVSFAGGAKELVRPEVDALTHRPGDAAGLARAIERLTNDVTLRQRLGSAARSAANERFDPDRTLDQVLGLYAGFEKAVPV